MRTKLILLGAFVFSLLACSKPNEPLVPEIVQPPVTTPVTPPPIDPRLNIDLHGQPLALIQQYLKGNWKLNFTKGGICGVCMTNYPSYFWNFSEGDKIQLVYNNNIVTDTVITWVYRKDVFGVNSYVMDFTDRRDYPNGYVVSKIKNDTLILYDDASDPAGYYLTKSP
ncbi:MAG: hypothetical protein V4539_23700 [Bacteroidota bacterium]